MQCPFPIRPLHPPEVCVVWEGNRCMKRILGSHMDKYIASASSNKRRDTMSCGAGTCPPHPYLVYGQGKR
ncbi:Palmitoyltransferase PFA3 [Fusarium oxysporum f. sp. albedinis]|nr:Palmitoyltransferase PFA3 [Fusarium oxysporum f. sp. albedinis]